MKILFINCFLSCDRRELKGLQKHSKVALGCLFTLFEKTVSFEHVLKISLFLSHTIVATCVCFGWLALSRRLCNCLFPHRYRGIQRDLGYGNLKMDAFDSTGLQFHLSCSPLEFAFVD